MKHRTIVALSSSAVIYSAAVGADAQESLWKVQKNDEGTVVATVAMDHPEVSGSIVTLLNVGFGTRNGCRAEVGIAILKGGSYGSTLGKLSPPKTEPISLSVDEIKVS